MENNKALSTLPNSPLRFSRKRLAIAFGVAALSDALTILFTFSPPLQWTVDLLTAFLLYLILGRQWILLPGLILEAIPAINLFPFWLLVVAAIALLGDPRPHPKALQQAAQDFGARLSGKTAPSQLPHPDEEK